MKAGEAGSAPWICGGGAPTGNYHDGQIWVDGSGYLQARTGGATKKMAPSVVDDASPQLGGDLSLNANWITANTNSGGGTHVTSPANQGVLGMSDNGSVLIGVSYEAGGLRVQDGSQGSLTQGFTKGAGARLDGNGPGSFAHGYIYAAAGYDSFIEANTWGAMAGGFHYSGQNASVIADGYGSIAWGGHAFNGKTVQTSGAAAFALGSDVDCYAQANNCIQVGEGTNDLNQSIKAGPAGSAPWLIGSGAPSPNYHNGQIWVANDYIYVRTKGTTRKITATDLSAP
jgi:hypothetical protein